MLKLLWKYILYPSLIAGLFITLGIGIYSQSAISVPGGFLMTGILLEPLWSIAFIAVPLAFLGHLIFRLDKDKKILIQDDGPHFKQWVNLATLIGIGLLVACITMLYLITTPNPTNAFWMNGFGLPLAGSLGFSSWTILRYVSHIKWKRNPSSKIRIALNIVKGLTFLACIYSIVLSIATQFSVPGLGWMVGLSSNVSLLSFAASKIAEALGIGGLEMGFLWLNAFSIGIFATAGFVAFNIIKSWPKSDWKSKVAKGSFLLVPFVWLLAVVEKFIPGSITSLFLPFGVVSIIMPLASYFASHYCKPKRSANFPMSKRIGNEILVFALLNTSFLCVPLANVLPYFRWASPPLTASFSFIIGLGVAVTMTFRIYDQISEQIREARRGIGGPAPDENDGHPPRPPIEFELKEPPYYNPDISLVPERKRDSSTPTTPLLQQQSATATEAVARSWSWSYGQSMFARDRSSSGPLYSQDSYRNRGNSDRIDAAQEGRAGDVSDIHPGRSGDQTPTSESSEPPAGYRCV